MTGLTEFWKPTIYSYTNEIIGISDTRSNKLMFAILLVIEGIPSRLTALCKVIPNSS